MMIMLIAFCLLLFAFCLLSFALCLLSFAFCLLSFALCLLLLPFTLCLLLLPFTLCLLSFVFCLLSFAYYLLPILFIVNNFSMKWFFAKGTEVENIFAAQGVASYLEMTFKAKILGTYCPTSVSKKGSRRSGDAFFWNWGFAQNIIIYLVLFLVLFIFSISTKSENVMAK